MDKNIEQVGPVSVYPVSVSVTYPEHSSRLLALATLLFFIPKLLILIPHMIALWGLSIIATFVWLFGQIAVLFTGKFPKGLFDFLVGFTIWSTRVSAYMYGLTDKYPPFQMR